MRRRPFTLASLLSLLMCAAALVLCVRSDMNRLDWTFRWHGHACALFADRGRVGVDNVPEVKGFRDSRDLRLHALVAKFNSMNNKRDREAKEVYAEIKTVGASRPPASFENAFHLWPVALCLTVLPGIWLTRFHYRHFRKELTPSLKSASALYGESSIKHRLFTFGSAVSLLLCAASVVLWVRGDSDRLQLIFRRHGSVYAVYTDRGRAGVDNWPEIEDFLLENTRKLRLLVARSNGMAFRGDEDLRARIRIHAEISAVNLSRGPPLVRYRVPLWSVAATFLALPVIWVARFHRRQLRVVRGQCLSCSYNLTGNISGVCPECGTAIHSKGMPIKIA